MVSVCGRARSGATPDPAQDPTGKGPDHRHEQGSAIGTLIECGTAAWSRSTCPGGKAPRACDALTGTVESCRPTSLRPLTRDQGSEMASHQVFGSTTDIRPRPAHPRRPRFRRRRTPPSPTQNARLGNPSRASVRTTRGPNDQPRVATTPRMRRGGGTRGLHCRRAATRRMSPTRRRGCRTGRWQWRTSGRRPACRRRTEPGNGPPATGMSAL